jgi:hypothetical protein
MNGRRRRCLGRGHRGAKDAFGRLGPVGRSPATSNRDDQGRRALVGDNGILPRRQRGSTTSSCRPLSVHDISDAEEFANVHSAHLFGDLRTIYFNGLGFLQSVQVALPAAIGNSHGPRKPRRAPTRDPRPVRSGGRAGSWRRAASPIALSWREPPTLRPVPARARHKAARLSGVPCSAKR